MTLYAARLHKLPPREEMSAPDAPRTGWIHERDEPWRVITADDRAAIEQVIWPGLGEIVEYTGDEPTVDIYEAWPRMRPTARIERRRLEEVLRATAEALHLPAGCDPNDIPAAAAAAYDAAANLREQLDRVNAGRQQLQEDLDERPVDLHFGIRGQVPRQPQPIAAPPDEPR